MLVANERKHLDTDIRRLLRSTLITLMSFKIPDRLLISPIHNPQVKKSKFLFRTLERLMSLFYPFYSNSNLFLKDLFGL